MVTGPKGQSAFGGGAIDAGVRVEAGNETERESWYRSGNQFLAGER